MPQYARHIKKNLLQAIADQLPQLLIWYDFHHGQVCYNSVAEQLLNEKHRDALAHIGLIDTVRTNKDDTIATFSIDTNIFLKCQLLACDFDHQLHYRVIFLQRVKSDLPATELHLELKNLEHFQKQTLKPVFEMIARWDPKDLDEHYRTAVFASRIAKALELSEETQNNIFISAMLMDIGAMIVSAEIMDTPRHLSDIEFSLIQTHAESGYKILHEIPFEAPIAEFVLQHHERYDGSGYPAGLQSDEIWLEARILGVADTLIAMTSERPHRKALTLEQAMVTVKKQAGVKFDPIVASLCIQLIENNQLDLQVFVPQLLES